MVLGTLTLAVNGERLRVPNTYDPSTKLIEVLRSQSRFTGPKVGCGEGGCGACTVLVDQYDPVTGVVSRATINACLATIGSCDGVAITTAEGLGNSKTGFHPAQEALAKRFGSQCGYCTPGIMVALAAAAEQAAAADGTGDSAAGADSARAVAIARGLDGNLCRCTGWRPIIDAARDIADLEDLDKQQCCKGSSNGSPQCCSDSSSSSSSSSKCTSLLPTPAAESFPDWLKQYMAAKHYNNQRELQQQLLAGPEPPLMYTSGAELAGSPPPTAVPGLDCCGGQRWLKPGSLQQLAAVLRRHCGHTRAKLVAGNTGAGVYKDLWPHDYLVVDLGSVRELRDITYLAEGVILGGGLTIQQLISVLRSPGGSKAGSSTAKKQCSGSGSCGNRAADGGCSGNGGSCVPASGGAAGPPSSTKAVWGAMADHLERVAGVPVRSAATLGGHFGLCTIKPLPTDLGLVLAAAGAWVQVLRVPSTATPTDTPAAAYAAHTHGGYKYGWRQEQQQQQEQQLDLGWVSVEDYLAGSCVGSAGSSNSSDTNCFITAEGVAGARLVLPDQQPVQGWQQQQQQQQYNGRPCNSSDVTAAVTAACPAATDAASGGAVHGATGPAYRVITAVWLPYGNDAAELFWSYKVALRHVNSHALVNAAVWLRMDQSTVAPANSSSVGSSSSGGSSCSSSSGSGGLSELSAAGAFAGASIAAARLFVGFPPSPPGVGWPAAAAAAAAAAAGGDAAASGVGASAIYRWQQEHWRVLRVTDVEQGLKGKPVEVKDIIAALRQLECQLSGAGLAPCSFHAQTLQGLLLKALVPLLNPTTLQALLPGAAAGPNTASLTTSSSSGGSSSSVSDCLASSAPGLCGAQAAAAAARLLRLLQLPEPYNPKQLPQGRQVLPGPDKGSGCAAAAPVHLAIEKDAVRLQASGEALYAADVAAGMRGRLLYLAGVKSTEALAAIDEIDGSAALALPGVVGLVTAADIPGSNEVFNAPLLADGRVEYVGQPIALVAATSQTAADRAASLVKVSYSQLPDRTPIITIDQAVAAGAFHDNVLLQASAARPQSNWPHVQSQQSVAAAGNAVAAEAPATCNTDSSSSSTGGSSDVVLGGDDGNIIDRINRLIATATCKINGGCYSLPAQQHMYMEPQVTVAEPQEDGAVRVTSATQSLDAVQKAVAAVLGVPFNKVSVVTKRLGGGFGGKASRSMPVAAAAALAASMFGAPVCYSLSRSDDFAQNAGRCAGRVRYDVGFSPSGKVVAIKAEVIFRAGAYLDLASNDGAQLIAASDSAYDLSGLHVSVKLARCNLPPHTIVRGPGYLQGVMLMEQIMEHVAASLGMDAAAVKAANFLPDVAASQSKPVLPLSLAACEQAIAGGAQAAAEHSGATVESSLPSSAGRLCIGSVGVLEQQRQQRHASDSSRRLPVSTRGTRTAAGGISPDTSGDESAAAAAAPSGVTTILGRFISSDSYTLPRIWAELMAGQGPSCSYTDRLAAVQQYNREHAWSKRGIAVTPVRFDCSPAAVSAAVNVFADGSVLVTHGGIEMGQGLSTKVKQAAVAGLSLLLPEEQRPLPLSLVRLAPSSSDVVPNGGPTWSSTGSEGNCQAVMNAAAKVVAQMAPFIKVEKDGMSTWQATLAAICPDVGFAPAAAMLSAYGYYDGTVGSGSAKQPVQYSAYGAAVTEVEFDVLTGERKVLSSHIMYDCGYALNPGIDLGQVEGAFVMGLGVMISEDVVVDESTGELLSGSTWKYKIPTPDLIPQSFTVQFLADAPNPRGILSSKASGEPALMTSTSALLALQQAAAAAVQEVQGLPGPATAVTGAGSGGVGEGTAGPSNYGWCVLAAPATPEKLKGVVGSFSIADALEAALALQLHRQAHTL